MGAAGTPENAFCHAGMSYPIWKKDGLFTFTYRTVESAWFAILFFNTAVLN